MIEDLDDQSVVLVVDFAENYDHNAQDEAQSHRWGHEATTLHPIIAIFKNVNGKIARHAVNLMSDDRKHDSFAATHLVAEAIKYLRIKKPQLKKFYIFSDGAAGQYKGKTAVYKLSLFKIGVQVI